MLGAKGSSRLPPLEGFVNLPTLGMDVGDNSGDDRLSIESLEAESYSIELNEMPPGALL